MPTFADDLNDFSKCDATPTAPGVSARAVESLLLRPFFAPTPIELRDQVTASFVHQVGLVAESADSLQALVGSRRWQRLMRHSFYLFRWSFGWRPALTDKSFLRQNAITQALARLRVAYKLESTLYGHMDRFALPPPINFHRKSTTLEFLNERIMQLITGAVF